MVPSFVPERHCRLTISPAFTTRLISARREPYRLNVREYASPYRVPRPCCIMNRLSKGLRPVGFPILVGAGLLAAWWIAAGCVWAGDGQSGGSESERAQRIEALQKERNRIERELNQLKQQPDGVSRSSVPRLSLIHI